MKWVWTVLAYAASLAAIAVVSFFVVIILAGPHSDLLPRFLQIPIVILAWLAVLVLPVLVARSVYRRVNKDS